MKTIYLIIISTIMEHRNKSAVVKVWIEQCIY